MVQTPASFLLNKQAFQVRGPGPASDCSALSPVPSAGLLKEAKAPAKAFLANPDSDPSSGLIWEPILDTRQVRVQARGGTQSGKGRIPPGLKQPGMPRVISWASTLCLALVRKQEEGGPCSLTLPSLQILYTLKTQGDPPPATHILLLFLWGPQPCFSSLGCSWLLSSTSFQPMER